MEDALFQTAVSTCRVSQVIRINAKERAASQKRGVIVINVISDGIETLRMKNTNHQSSGSLVGRRNGLAYLAQNA